MNNLRRDSWDSRSLPHLVLTGRGEDLGETFILRNLGVGFILGIIALRRCWKPGDETASRRIRRRIDDRTSCRGTWIEIGTMMSPQLKVWEALGTGAYGFVLTRIGRSPTLKNTMNRGRIAKVDKDSAKSSRGGGDKSNDE